jgi:hypothetical protein
MVTELSIDWLARHGCELRSLLDASTLVLLDGSPQYKLVAVPAKGKFTCAITQMVNGRRIDKGVVYPDASSAIAGGLDELRQDLGW